MNYHFETETFLTSWKEWKDYRKKVLRKPIKDEQRALNNIFELSQGNEQIAYLIMKRSMDNEYQGLFPLPVNYQMQVAPQGKISQIQQTSNGLLNIIEQMYGSGNK